LKLSVMSGASRAARSRSGPDGTSGAVNFSYGSKKPKIPSQDCYGNSTTGAAYTKSLLYNTYHVAYDSTKPNNGYHMELASWAAVDNAGQRILSDSAMNIAIYTIGLTGNGGVDKELLKRLSNVQDTPNSNYQTGLYVEASDAASLQHAFGQVASEVLRLAK